MAETKRLKTRFVQKHDLEANWIRAASFIPLQGEVIIYDAETQETFEESVSKLNVGQQTQLGRSTPITYQRIKVGDGINTVTNLPFVGGDKDWSQNDSTKPDYIENRTHYVDSMNVVHKLDAKYIPDEYVTDNELTNKGYATTTFVEQKIAEAQLSGEEVDLSSYATKEYVDDKMPLIYSGTVDLDSWLTSELHDGKYYYSNFMYIPSWYYYGPVFGVPQIGSYRLTIIDEGTTWVGDFDITPELRNQFIKDYSGRFDIVLKSSDGEITVQYDGMATWGTYLVTPTQFSSTATLYLNGNTHYAPTSDDNYIVVKDSYGISLNLNYLKDTLRNSILKDCEADTRRWEVTSISTFAETSDIPADSIPVITAIQGDPYWASWGMTTYPVYNIRIFENKRFIARGFGANGTDSATTYPLYISFVHVTDDCAKTRLELDLTEVPNASAHEKLNVMFSPHFMFESGIKPDVLTGYRYVFDFEWSTILQKWAVKVFTDYEYVIEVPGCSSCDTCQSCDSCEGCLSCDSCESCQNSDGCSCDSCLCSDNCGSCESCEDCDSCQSSESCSCDSCQSCDSCDSCESCDLCLSSDGCECNSCQVCENCDGCEGCMGCDGCDTCQNCENCQSCDSCESCLSSDGCSCDSCLCSDSCSTCLGSEGCSCDNCQCSDGGSCDSCMCSDSCGTCQCSDSCGTCQCSDGCGDCQGCMSCEDCESCQGSDCSCDSCLCSDNCGSCETCESCQDCQYCQGCDGCQSSDGSGGCGGCETCMSSDSCSCDGCMCSDSCSTCQCSDSCSTCQCSDSCNTCQGSDCSCDTCQGSDCSCDSCQCSDGCDGCQSGDSCNICESCQSCDSCEGCMGSDCSCDSCENCMSSDNCSCYSCQCSDSCSSCQSSDGCSCDSCQSDDGGGCGDCETCMSSDGCSCDGCMCSDGCNGCQSCDSCEGCEGCQGCQGCDSCESCQGSDGCSCDSCQCSDSSACGEFQNCQNCMCSDASNGG